MEVEVVKSHRLDIVSVSFTTYGGCSSAVSDKGSKHLYSYVVLTVCAPVEVGLHANPRLSHRVMKWFPLWWRERCLNLRQKQEPF